MNASSEANNWPLKMRVVLLVLAGLLTIGSYWSSLHGDFVYDDINQIATNPLIRDPGNIGQMMVSDVWSFKGESSQAWSNYWRPTFMLWLTLNYKFFGVDVVGWHVLSVLLHVGVMMLGFLLLLRLRVPDIVASAVTLIFAVHPVHVESVSWASGSPDILMTGFFFGSVLLYLRWRENKKPLVFAGALALYGLALLSKEIAITFPILIGVTEWGMSAERSYAKAARVAVPFIIVALLYLVGRYAVLHLLRSNAIGAPGILSAIATIPLLVVFYLGQSIAPWRIGPNYGLRAVNTKSVDVLNFYGPLVLIAAMSIAVWKLCRRNSIYLFGATWFLVPLLPALDVRSFHPEQIVHDRYLYLPIFGFALFFAYGLYELLSSRRVLAYAALFGVATVALGAQTYRYGPAWSSEIALWERGVAVDSTSATTFAGLSEAYRQESRFYESKIAAEKALAIDPDYAFAMGPLAAIEIQQGNTEKGRDLLRKAVKLLPRYEFAWDHLALSYSTAEDVNQAISVFEESVKVNPWRRMKAASNIAVLLVGQGRHKEALDRLLVVRKDMLRATRPDDFRGLYFTAELLLSDGRSDEAEECYRAFVTKARGIQGLESMAQRAAEQLKMLEN